MARLRPNPSARSRPCKRFRWNARSRSRSRARATRGCARVPGRTGSSARLERGVDVLLAVSTALVIAHGAWLVLRQELSTGDLLVFLAYLKSTFSRCRTSPNTPGGWRKRRPPATASLRCWTSSRMCGITLTPCRAFAGAISFRERDVRVRAWRNPSWISSSRLRPVVISR